MKKFIQNLLRDSLLIENKLYPNKMVDAVTKKIGDTSDDTKNKINIAGLWRDYFGNIQQVKSKEQLDDVFKSWYDKMISDIIKTKSFYDNKDLAEKYLNAYIENIGSLGDKANRFSLKKIEKGLVDLVNNNNWIKDTSVSTNSIYEPHGDDILDENDDIIILNAPNKAKCVTYGQKESWCIGKPELNYYNTYRLSYGATPYYVLQKNIEGNEHKLVIMNYGDGDYAIADRSNTGNRHGGRDVSMSWSQIEQEIPNLKGKEQFFKYRKITEDERRYADALKKRYEGDDLQSYFDKLSSELVVNGENVKSVDIVRDYAANNYKITSDQFSTLRDDVKDSLIESGYFLKNGSEEYNLTDKQLGRVVRLKLYSNRKLNYRELMMLSEDERTKYIQNLDMYGIKYLLKNSPSPDAIIKVLLGTEGFVQNLDDGGIHNLLSNSSNPNAVIKVLLGTEGFIQNLDNGGIEYLLKNSPSPDAIIKVLLGTEGFIQKLDRFGIRNLLIYSSNPDVVMKTVGQKGVDFIQNLDRVGIRSLLEHSTNKDGIIKLLLGTEGFIQNLDVYGIRLLLEYSSNPDAVIKVLLGTEGFVQKLNNGGIHNLLSNSSNPNAIIKVLLGTEGFIQKLDRFGIRNLLIYSSNPDVVMKTLGQKGVDFIQNLDKYGIRDSLKVSPNPDETEVYLKKVRPDLFEQNESINLIKKLLREGLNESISLNLSKQLRNTWDKSKLDDIFGKNVYRLYYNLETGKQITPTRKTPKLKFDVKNIEKLNNDISSMLKKYNYSIVDMDKNIAKNNKSNQNIKISKILNKLDFKLLKNYNSYLDRLNRSNDEGSDLYVVVSRHPHDLASKSAKPRITSCEDLRDMKDLKDDDSNWTSKGQHDGEGGAGQIRDSILDGDVIFYLIEDGDWNIQDPISRYVVGVLCTDKKIKAPIDMYGSYNIEFSKFIEQWSDTYHEEVNNISKKDLSDISDSEILEKIRSTDINDDIYRHVLVEGRYETLKYIIEKMGIDMFVSETKGIYTPKIYKEIDKNLNGFLGKSYKSKYMHIIRALRGIKSIKGKKYTKDASLWMDMVDGDEDKAIQLLSTSLNNIIPKGDINIMKIIIPEYANELERLANSYNPGLIE